MSYSKNESLKWKGQVILTGAYGNDVNLSLSEGINRDTIDIYITTIPDFDEDYEPEEEHLGTVEIEKLFEGIAEHGISIEDFQEEEIRTIFKLQKPSKPFDKSQGDLFKGSE